MRAMTVQQSTPLETIAAVRRHTWIPQLAFADPRDAPEPYGVAVEAALDRLEAAVAHHADLEPAIEQAVAARCDERDILRALTAGGERLS